MVHFTDMATEPNVPLHEATAKPLPHLAGLQALVPDAGGGRAAGGGVSAGETGHGAKLLDPELARAGGAGVGTVGRLCANGRGAWRCTP